VQRTKQAEHALYRERYEHFTRFAAAAAGDGVLYAVPAVHLEKGHVLVSAAGRNAAGRTVARQSLRPPRR
jgi:hypothetical protein